MRLVVVALALVVCACTKQNPSACGDGVCNDPALPFCDTQGTLGGAVNECVAVSCTPGEFAECRGDVSVVCNEAGDNYDLVECVRGCDGPTGGCHIDPSNDLGQYFDMVPDPPDIEIVSGTIDTHTGEINGSAMYPSFLVPAPPDGSSIRVFVARRVKLGNVEVAAPHGGTQPALAILATDTITIEDELRFTFSTFGTAGGNNDAFDECVGGPGVCLAGGTDLSLCGGGGGGGHATSGAVGGEVTATDAIGGTGGVTTGAETLVPLRGGCGSQGATTTFGGGAVQLSSAVGVRVIGRIDVHGQGGKRTSSLSGAHELWSVMGGGAGGAILLEAPTVELGSTAELIAKGGGGASREFAGSETLGPYPTIGASCSLEACGSGGDGASAMSAPAPGSPTAFDPGATTNTSTGGGGGGGLGRVRINTGDGAYDRSPTTVEAGRSTSGVMARR